MTALLAGGFLLGSAGDGAYAADSVKIDAEHFEDQILRSALTVYDGDGDGSLSPAEISEITELRLVRTDLQRLKGIKYLSELTTLDCSDC